MDPALVEFLDKAIPWHHRSPSGLTRVDLYRAMGLTNEQGNALSPVGKWLCQIPAHPLWKLGKGDQREKNSPLKILGKMWNQFTCTHTVELMSWLLTDPTTYSPEVPEDEVPHLKATNAGGHLLWTAKIPQTQYIGILVEGHTTAVCKALQLIGTIRHSRFVEFAESYLSPTLVEGYMLMSWHGLREAE